MVVLYCYFAFTYYRRYYWYPKVNGSDEASSAIDHAVQISETDCFLSLYDMTKSSG